MNPDMRTGGGDENGQTQGPQPPSQDYRTSSSASYPPPSPTDNGLAGSTQRESTPAAADGVQWVACDIPPWACRSCQRILAGSEQGKEPRTPTQSHVGANVLGVQGEMSPARTVRAQGSARDDARYAGDNQHAQGAPSSTHRAGAERESNIPGIDYDTMSGSSSTDNDGDSDWEESASAYTASPSDSSDEDYNPSAATKRAMGRGLGKARKGIWR